ncbi:DNA repair protein [Bacteroidia bacterium]|nr:DNA repair protein [Bacteroidia bacterium]
MQEPIKLTVKDWSPEDRPREKMLAKGVYTLSDAELLAIILGSGNREESVVELSQRILQSAGNNLNELGKYSINQLMKFKGIGSAKAISVVAVLELGKRRKAEEIRKKEQIRFSKDIYDYFHSLLCDLFYEEFWVLFLSRGNRIIDKMKISQGGVSETVVDPKIIYREAINRLASGIILCHNHPSGNPQPSRQDDKITMKIREGVKLLDLTLIDHVIICDDGFYSYADNGRV